MSNLTELFMQSLRAGYVKGISENWRPDFLNRMARVIPKQESEKVQVYGLLDAALPTINAPAIEFESPGQFNVTIDELDDYDKGFKFTRKDADRVPDVIAQGAQIPRLFGRKYDGQAATLIVEGDTTTYTIPGQDTMWGGSGVTFFSGTGAGHIYTGGAVYTTAQLNLLQKAEVAALQIATANAPTEAEWKKLVDGCRQYIADNIRDTSGEKLFTGNEKMDILVPLGLEYGCRGAFQVPLVTTGGTNVYSRILSGGEIIPDGRLSDAGIFYLSFDLGGGERPLWFVRGKVNGQDLEFVKNSEGDSHYVKFKEYLMRASARVKLCYGDWRLMFRCVTST